MANILSAEKQEAAIRCLMEGSSLRSTERMIGVHRDTIMRLVERVGAGCEVLMDETMRNLPCKNVEVDEIWGFVAKKQRHLRRTDDASSKGDMWTYVALDRDTKLVPSYLVGKRTAENTRAFIKDLSGRLANRVQLSSDSLIQYLEATEMAFGKDVDYGQIVKVFEHAEPIGAGRYSPPHVVATEKTVIRGNPDMALISTSHVERLNLSIRMASRRHTRLTNAFSKKMENLQASMAVFFVHYNFCRRHQTLRVTPAMQAGLVNDFWSIGDLLKAAAWAA